MAALVVVVVAVVILGHWATRSFEDHVQAVALVGLVTTGALLGIVTLASLGSSSWVRLALR